MKDLEGTPTSRIRMLKKAVSVGMSGGRKIHQPYTVIDTGAEKDLIG